MSDDDPEDYRRGVRFGCLLGFCAALLTIPIFGFLFHLVRD